MDKIFPDMYARDSAGNLLNWRIRVKDHPLTLGSAIIIISEGRIEGKLTEISTSIHKGKNIGKINETTPLQQAVSQAESRIEKKRKQGYKTLADLYIFDIPTRELKDLIPVIENALPFYRTDANDLLKPMKAQKYFKDDGSVRITFPCYGQPKLNGFRCMARLEVVTTDKGTLLETTTKKVVFRSKEGLAYTCLEHIEAEFKDHFFDESNRIENPGKLVFDGEMYAAGLSLQDISSAVRKKNPNTLKIKFHIFDIAVHNENQVRRIHGLIYLRDQLFRQGVKNVIVVDTIEIPSNEVAQEATDLWIKEGYEGGIFRSKSAMYQFGSRPQTMVKLKRSEDKEFKIIDVVGGDNTPDLGIFVCLAENGKEFRATPEGTAAEKREYLTNKANYIGKPLTVRFFERTNDGKPFHATGVTVRDYE